VSKFNSSSRSFLISFKIKFRQEKPIKTRVFIINPLSATSIWVKVEFQGQGRILGQGQIMGQGQILGQGRILDQGRISGQDQILGQGEISGQGQILGQGLILGQGQIWVRVEFWLTQRKGRTNRTSLQTF